MTAGVAENVATALQLVYPLLQYVCVCSNTEGGQTGLVKLKAQIKNVTAAREKEHKKSHRPSMGTQAIVSSRRQSVTNKAITAARGRYSFMEAASTVMASMSPPRHWQEAARQQLG